MAAEVGALRVVLGIDLAQFTAGLKRAQTQLGGFASKATGALGQLSSFAGSAGLGKTAQGIDAVADALSGMSVAAVGAAAVVGAGALGGALVLVTKQTADFGDELIKASDRVGIGVEALQELRYAADLAGVSSGDLQGSLEKFGRAIGKAAIDTRDGFGKTLIGLGISIRDVNGQIRPLEDLFLEYADAIASAGSEQEALALTTAAFGRGSTEMINFLRAGRTAIQATRNELRQLGYVMSEDTARRAEEFNDNLSRVATVLNGIKLQIGSELLPVLERLVQWLLAHKDDIKNFFVDGSNQVIEFGQTVIATLELFNRTELTPLFKQFEGLLGWIDRVQGRLDSWPRAKHPLRRPAAPGRNGSRPISA